MNSKAYAIALYLIIKNIIKISYERYTKEKITAVFTKEYIIFHRVLENTYINYYYSSVINKYTLRISKYITNIVKTLIFY